MFEGNRAVSMKALHSLYITEIGSAHEKVYRNRLKCTIVSKFGNQLKFLFIDGKSPEILVSTEGLHSTMVVKDKSVIFEKSADYLRQDILDYADMTERASWPLQSSQLKKMKKSFLSS